MKRTFSRFVAFFMVTVCLWSMAMVYDFVGVGKVSAIEEIGRCGDDVRYSFDESNGKLVINGKGEMWDFLGNALPFSDIKVKTVEIKPGVTSIGENSFADCDALVSVSLPDGLKFIGDSAFSCCHHLTDITIPYGVVRIGGMAFQHCISLESVVLPDSVVSVGVSSFFQVCNVEVNTDLDTSEWGAKCINGYIEDGLVYPDSSMTEVCACCFTQAGKVVVPNSVKTIRDFAFNGCSELVSLTLSQKLTTIGRDAFAGCVNLSALTIPNSVKTMGIGAFSDCYKIKSLTLSNGLKELDSNVFASCIGLKTVTIPEGIQTIKSGVFRDCSGLTSVKLPDSLRKIERGAFAGCTAIKKLTVPSGIKTIEDWAFLQVFQVVTSKSYGTVSLGAKAVNGYIKGNLAYSDSKKTKFCGCYVTQKGAVTIPGTVTSIGDYAFADCRSVTEITIPNSVTSIGGYAFSYCTGLKTLTVPSSVTSIGNFAFEGTKVKLRGYKGSYVEKYAKENELSFQSLGTCKHAKQKTVTVKATCQKAGYEDKICSNCGLKVSHKTIAKTQHKDSNNDYLCDVCKQCLISDKKVSGFSVSAQSGESITLQWKALKKASGYRVYRLNNKTNKYEKVKDTKATSLKVTGLKADTTEFFKIRAYCKINGKVYWGVLSNKLLGQTGPEAITELKATSTKTGITLRWKKVTSASFYRIYLFDKQTGKYQKAKDVKTDHVTLSGLKRATSYLICVRPMQSVEGGTLAGTTVAVTVQTK